MLHVNKNKEKQIKNILFKDCGYKYNKLKNMTIVELLHDCGGFYEFFSNYYKDLFKQNIIKVLYFYIKMIIHK